LEVGFVPEKEDHLSHPTKGLIEAITDRAITVRISIFFIKKLKI